MSSSLRGNGAPSNNQTTPSNATTSPQSQHPSSNRPTSFVPVRPPLQQVRLSGGSVQKVQTTGVTPTLEGHK